MYTPWEDSMASRFWQEGAGLWLLTHPGQIVSGLSLLATGIAIALGWPLLICLVTLAPAFIVFLEAHEKATRVSGIRRAEEAERRRLKQVELEAERVVELEKAIEHARARKREQ